MTTNPPPPSSPTPTRRNVAGGVATNPPYFGGLLTSGKSPNNVSKPPPPPSLTSSHGRLSTLAVERGSSNPNGTQPKYPGPATSAVPFSHFLTPADVPLFNATTTRHTEIEPPYRPTLLAISSTPSTSTLDRAFGSPTSSRASTFPVSSVTPRPPPYLARLSQRFNDPRRVTFTPRPNTANPPPHPDSALHPLTSRSSRSASAAQSGETDEMSHSRQIPPPEESIESESLTVTLKRERIIVSCLSPVREMYRDPPRPVNARFPTKTEREIEADEDWPNTAMAPPDSCATLFRNSHPSTSTRPPSRTKTPPPLPAYRSVKTPTLAQFSRTTRSRTRSEPTPETWRPAERRRVDPRAVSPETTRLDNVSRFPSWTVNKCPFPSHRMADGECSSSDRSVTDRSTTSESPVKQRVYSPGGRTTTSALHDDALAMASTMARTVYPYRTTSTGMVRGGTGKTDVVAVVAGTHTRADDRGDTGSATAFPSMSARAKSWKSGGTTFGRVATNPDALFSSHDHVTNPYGESVTSTGYSTEISIPGSASNIPTNTFGSETNTGAASTSTGS